MAGTLLRASAHAWCARGPDSFGAGGELNFLRLFFFFLIGDFAGFFGVFLGFYFLNLAKQHV